MFGTWGMGWFLEEEEEPFGLLKHLQDAFSKEGAAFWRRDCLEVVPSVVDVNWALDLQRWEGLLWLIQSNFPTEAVVPRWRVHSLLWGHVTGTGVSLLLPILSTSSWAASIEWINPIEKVFFQSSVLLFYSPPSLMCTGGKSGSGQPTRWQSTEKVRVVPLTVTFHQTWEALQFCCLIHVTREKVGTRKQNEKRKMTSLLQLGRGKGHSGSWTLWCNQTGLSQVLQEVQKLGLDLYVFTSALRSQWKKLFAGSEQSSGLLSDASWINGKGASVCPGEMHADCLQASPWLILGNFRLKCSFSFCSSVGPEIKCQILTLPQPANLVICKTQMQTLSLQLHLRSWQTQANWCCLAFSSPSLCSFAFFLLPQPHLPSSAGNFVGDLCPAWSCLPEGGCVLPCLFLPKQAFPCPKIAFTPNVCFHPRCSKSHHVPMGRRYELLQVRAAFLQPCVMAAEKFRLFPSEKYQRKIPGSQSFLSKCRGFPRESSTWF